MKNFKFLSVSTLSFLLFAVPQLFAFSEDWEDFSLGSAPSTIISEYDWESVGATDPYYEQVRDLSMDLNETFNLTKYLSLRAPAGSSNYRRFTALIEPVTHKVDFSLDVKGFRQIMIRAYDNWDDNDYAWVLFETDGTVTVKDGTIGNVDLCNWSVGHWYHLVISLTLDPDDGTKSKYDVSIYDIENGNTLIGSVTDIDWVGNPYYLGKIELTTHPLSDETGSYALFDNILINQNTVEVNAADFGFTSSDATTALQGAIDSQADIIHINDMGIDWIVEPIFLRSAQKLMFEDGVKVKAKTGSFTGLYDCMFAGEKIRDTEITGCATFEMRKADYLGSGYEESQWRHCFSLRSCYNVLIDGPRILSSGGDGIYIGVSDSDVSDAPGCKNTIIRNVLCENNYRDAITVTSAIGLVIENGIFRTSDGFMVMSGIDFEPNRNIERLDDIIVRNCIFEDNSYWGILLNAMRMHSPADVTIQNCTIRNNNYAGIHLSNDETTILTSLVLKDNLFVGNSPALSSSNLPVGTPAINLEYCCFWNNTVTDPNFTLGTGCITAEPDFYSANVAYKYYGYLEDTTPASILTGSSTGSYIGAYPIIPNCSELGNSGGWLSGDFSGNCYVDLADFALIAENWLLCNTPQGSGCIINW